MFTLGSRSSQV